jgi:CelD/BcsL family acetyltransferase involved in cellulose biosynthesis
MAQAPVSTPTLRELDPMTDPRWRALVDAGDSTVFHSPQWLAAVHRSSGLSFTARVLEEDGVVKAGVVWSQMDDLLGVRRISLPFSDVCETVAAEPAQARLLAESVAGDGCPWTLRTRTSRRLDISTPVSGTTWYKLQTIDLTPSLEDLWEGVRKTARYEVRRTVREGAELCLAQDERDLREWFLLHLRLRKYKHRLLAQPYVFFESLWRAFVESGQGFLLLARAEGRVVAGSLFLVWKDGCYYKFNASDSDVRGFRPNNALLWHGMVEAKARGCRFLDLGRSSLHQEGLVAFKAGFGAVTEDIAALTYDATEDGARMREQREARRLLNEMTELFVQRSVPDGVTEQAGARLYRYFA